MEMMYREFWIRCTKEKLTELGEDLINDDRVEDFNKMEDDMCMTDAKNLARWLGYLRGYLEGLHLQDPKVHETLRQMKLMELKMLRKTKK